MCFSKPQITVNTHIHSSGGCRVQEVVTGAYYMGRNGPHNTTVVLAPLRRQGRSSKSTYRKSTVSKSVSRSEAEKNKIRNARLVKLGGHDKANAGSL